MERRACLTSFLVCSLAEAWNIGRRPIKRLAERNGLFTFIFIDLGAKWKKREFRTFREPKARRKEAPLARTRKQKIKLRLIWPSKTSQNSSSVQILVKHLVWFVLRQLDNRSKWRPEDGEVTADKATRLKKTCTPLPLRNQPVYLSLTLFTLSHDRPQHTQKSGQRDGKNRTKNHPLGPKNTFAFVRVRN